MKKAEVGCCHSNNGSLLIVTPGLVLLHHQSSTAPQCRVYVVVLFGFFWFTNVKGVIVISFRFFEAYLGGRRTSLPSFPPRTERYHCPVSFRSYYR